MPQGTVKWFDPKKGFGFIVNSEGQDVFVHFTVIEGEGFRALKDGETVEFEEHRGDKGLLAKAVKRLGRNGTKRQVAGELAEEPNGNVL